MSRTLATVFTGVATLVVVLSVDSATAGIDTSLPGGTCQNKDAEVLILGAGLAGLGAARTLSLNATEDFLIIEQDIEIGGRVKSRRFAGTTIELGAQWILNADDFELCDLGYYDCSRVRRHPLFEFADRCGISYRTSFRFRPSFRVYLRDGTSISSAPELGDAFNRFSTAHVVPSPILNILGDEDIPLSNGLRARGWFPKTPIEEWVELFGVDFAGFAESADHQSYKTNVGPEFVWLRDVSFTPPGLARNEKTFLVTDNVGFVGIAQCIANDFMTGDDDPRLILNTTVVSIEWSEECVCVNTVADSGNRRYCGTYAISTIPLGALQNNAVQFIPTLPPNVYLALHKLTMGRFTKVYAAYNETFWDTDRDVIGYIDDINGHDHYPIFLPWGAFFPEREKTNVIQAFLYGDIAKRVAYQDQEITRRQMGDALRNIYGSRLPDPLEIIVSPFAGDPHFLGSLGGVPTPGVTNETFRLLNRPIGNLYFAGDFVAWHFHSTAHGAYISGTHTGGKIVQLMQKPPRVSFLNNSPRVNGRNISAEFTVSKSVDTLECILDRGERQNCSSGRLEYTGLAEGPHILKVIARNEPRDDRGVETRGLYISDSPHCAVHLINDGISVHEESAVIQFTSTGLPVSSFECNMDGVRIFECSSPLELRDLSGGRHRIRIRPRCEGQVRQRSFAFFIERLPYSLHG